MKQIHVLDGSIELKPSTRKTTEVDVIYTQLGLEVRMTFDIDTPTKFEIVSLSNPVAASNLNKIVKESRRAIQRAALHDLIYT